MQIHIEQLVVLDVQGVGVEKIHLWWCAICRLLGATLVLSSTLGPHTHTRSSKNQIQDIDRPFGIVCWECVVWFLSSCRSKALIKASVMTYCGRVVVVVKYHSLSLAYLSLFGVVKYMHSDSMHTTQSIQQFEYIYKRAYILYFAQHLPCFERIESNMSKCECVYVLIRWLHHTNTNYQRIVHIREYIFTIYINNWWYTITFLGQDLLIYWHFSLAQNDNWFNALELNI